MTRVLVVIWAGLLLLGAVQPADAGTPTDPNLKVAFVGDSDAGSGFQSVLDKIQQQGAHIVVHSGDILYSSSMSSFQGKVNTTLGTTFPYFMSQGNHDTGSSEWGDIRNACSGAPDTHAEFIRCKLQTLGITPALGGNIDRYAIVHRGLKMVFLAERNDPTGDADFINAQLEGDDHLWKVCSWHKNQNWMQVGGKGNEVGWPPYEACREQGALIMTGHEHSYERTFTLSDIDTLTKDPTCSADPGQVCVTPGRTFVTVSGLGGTGVRNQDRCLPTAFPYGQGSGCNGIWARISTSDQENKVGALFITFHVDGDPAKAKAEFINVAGTVVDSFTITTTGSEPPPLRGDVNDDDVVNLGDLRRLLQMLLGQAPPNDAAQTLEAPADRLTLADGRELVQLLR